MATNVRELITPTLQALSDMNVLVVAAGVKDTAALGLDPLPGNARIEPFVAFKLLLPLPSAFQT